MKKSVNIVRYTAEELDEMIERGESKTDWARVGALPQAEVERLADEEDGPLPEGWEDTIVLGPPIGKRDVHIRLDGDVVDWFKAQGKGYQTRINAVLRSFVDLRQRSSADAVRRKMRAQGLTEADSQDAVDWARRRR